MDYETIAYASIAFLAMLGIAIIFLWVRYIVCIVRWFRAHKVNRKPDFIFYSQLSSLAYGTIFTGLGGWTLYQEFLIPILEASSAGGYFNFDVFSGHWMMFSMFFLPFGVWFLLHALRYKVELRGRIITFRTLLPGKSKTFSFDDITRIGSWQGVTVGKVNQRTTYYLGIFSGEEKLMSIPTNSWAHFALEDHLYSIKTSLPKNRRKPNSKTKSKTKNNLYDTPQYATFKEIERVYEKAGYVFDIYETQTKYEQAHISKDKRTYANIYVTNDDSYTALQNAQGYIDDTALNYGDDLLDLLKEVLVTYTCHNGMLAIQVSPPADISEEEFRAFFLGSADKTSFFAQAQEVMKIAAPIIKG